MTPLDVRALLAVQARLRRYQDAPGVRELHQSRTRLLLRQRSGGDGEPRRAAGSHAAGNALERAQGGPGRVPVHGQPHLDGVHAATRSRWPPPAAQRETSSWRGGRQGPVASIATPARTP